MSAARPAHRLAPARPSHPRAAVPLRERARRVLARANRGRPRLSSPLWDLYVFQLASSFRGRRGWTLCQALAEVAARLATGRDRDDKRDLARAYYRGRRLAALGWTGVGPAPILKNRPKRREGRPVDDVVRRLIMDDLEVTRISRRQAYRLTSL